MLLGQTAVELEIGVGTGTSGLEDTAVLNTANGQTAGLDCIKGFRFMFEPNIWV